MEEQRRKEQQLQKLGRPVHVSRLPIGRPVKLMEGREVLTGFVAHKGAGLVRVVTTHGERVLLPDTLVVQT